MLCVFNYLQSQVPYYYQVEASTTAPIQDCTPITLTFTLTQTDYDEEPLTGVTLDVYLLPNGF